MTLLQVASRHGNVVAVQQLLEAQPGPNINHQDELGKYSYPNYLKSIFFFIYIYRYGHIYVSTLDAPPSKPILLVIYMSIAFHSHITCKNRLKNEQAM